MTLSSLYKVSLIQSNDPLVLVRGQFKVRDPLVSVQGLASIYIYFIVFYFQTELN